MNHEWYTRESKAVNDKKILDLIVPNRRAVDFPPSIHGWIEIQKFDYFNKNDSIEINSNE
jgi:hypothetical protein